MSLLKLLLVVAVACGSLAAGQSFGSYITTCNATHVTFLNFKQSRCTGSSDTFSSPLKVCGLEFIPPLQRNLSWNAVCDGEKMTYNNYDDTQCTKGFLPRNYRVGGCYDCPNAECKDDVKMPMNVFGPLIREGQWFENQWHVAPGTVLVSSINSGKIFAVNYDATGDCVEEKECKANITEWLTGYDGTSGLAYDVKTKKAYALVTTKGTPGLNRLITFDPTKKGSVNVLATPPASLNLFGNTTLNGLAQHDTIPTIFYATNLANFSSSGFVLAINTSKVPATFTVAASNIAAADGAFVHKGMLYVSSVFSGEVLVFNIGSNPLAPPLVTKYKPPILTTLDDFFVADNTVGVATMVGADFGAGHVAVWRADGTQSATAHLVAAGLLHPTSVRPELDANGMWSTDYVTVTQGGDYPTRGRGMNGGKLYRLRLRNISAVAYNPGVLITWTCPDAASCPTNCTAHTTPLMECRPEGKDSVYVDCNLGNTTRSRYTGPGCTGTAKNTTTINNVCHAKDDKSMIELCGKL